MNKAREHRQLCFNRLSYLDQLYALNTNLDALVDPMFSVGLNEYWAIVRYIRWMNGNAWTDTKLSTTFDYDTTARQSLKSYNRTQTCVHESPYKKRKSLDR